jgi:hypothetical protein
LSSAWRLRQTGVVGGGRRAFQPGVARELDQLRGRYALTEEQSRGFRELMRFVEDDGVAGRQQLGDPFVPQHEIGEEQVVIDDHHVGRERLPARFHHETRVVARALRPQAVLPRGGDVRPDGGIFGHRGTGGLVSAARRPRKALDLVEVPDVVAALQPPVLERALQVVVADVVRAALQQRHGHRS